MTVKLTDFGLSKRIDDSNCNSDTNTNDNNNSTARNTICGTNEYMAPELFFDEDYRYNTTTNYDDNYDYDYDYYYNY